MKRTTPQSQDTAAESCLISLKTVARTMDARPTTVRRWLKEAGIQPIAIGRGRNGAIRYRWRDVQAWIESLESVE